MMTPAAVAGGLHPCPDSEIAVAAEGSRVEVTLLLGAVELQGIAIDARWSTWRC